MLDDLKLIHQRDVQDALGEAERRWRGNPQASGLIDYMPDHWTAIVPTTKNRAKQFALEVIGKTPVIYSGHNLAPAALAWKHGFNLYAKHVAWTGQYPEFMAAELTGWTRQPVHKPYTIIDLRSSIDDQQTQEAFELAERLLSGLRPAPIVIDTQGETVEQQLAWASALGDFVTIYTAILNGVNPSSEPLADKLNKPTEE